MKLIEEIRRHIKFLVTVGIFFSTLLVYFYKFVGSENDAPKTFLILGIVLGLSIANYLLIGATKKADERLLKGIRFSILLNIFLFILPMIILGISTSEPIPGYYKQIYGISFYGILWMPIVTFILILISVAQNFINKTKEK